MNTNRKKISELKEERARTIYYRDDYGNRVRDTEDIVVNYKVKTVKPGPRFGHYFIDLIFFQFLILTIQFLFALVALVFKELNLNFSSLVLDYIMLIFVLLAYPLMYFICEAFWQKTSGKFLTNTLVIDEYGDAPSKKKIVARSLFRLVPFEPFSCTDDYSYGWHDKWSETYVVTKSEYLKIKKMLEEQQDD